MHASPVIEVEETPDQTLQPMPLPTSKLTKYEMNTPFIHSPVRQIKCNMFRTEKKHLQVIKKDVLVTNQSTMGFINNGVNSCEVFPFTVIVHVLKNSYIRRRRGGCNRRIM